jgi:YggL 50S ribosome-binding protein
MVRREVRLSFSVRIVSAPGLSEAMSRRFLREWEDHVDEHGLVLEGTQLLWRVSSAERSLSADDQVDLLAWLADQPLVSEVRMSALCQSGDVFAQLEAGYAVLRTGDPCTPALTLLHRQRRLTAPMVLQALGGYVRPVLG